MRENVARVLTHAPCYKIWENNFEPINLKEMQKNLVPHSIIPETAAISLITRSGFEQKHVITSTIASW